MLFIKEIVLTDNEIREQSKEAHCLALIQFAWCHLSAENYDVFMAKRKKPDLSGFAKEGISWK